MYTRKEYNGQNCYAQHATPSSKGVHQVALGRLQRPWLPLIVWTKVPFGISSTALRCHPGFPVCLWHFTSHIISCVRVDGHNLEWFPILSVVRQGCVVAPDLFMVQMDWLMEHTCHRGMVDTPIGMEKEPFTDLHFTDDVVLLAESLSVLMLALEVVNIEPQLPGMSVNWGKTWDMGGSGVSCQHDNVHENEVEVKSFVTPRALRPKHSERGVYEISVRSMNIDDRPTTNDRPQGQ